MDREDINVQDILFNDQEEDAGTEEGAEGHEENEEGNEGDEGQEEQEDDADGDGDEGSEGDENGDGDEGSDEDGDDEGEGDEGDEGEGDDPLINQLASHMGIDLGEEEFPEDFDGLSKFTKHAATQIAQNELGKVFKAMPDVEQYLKYRAEGGKPDDYFKTLTEETQFDKVEISEENVNQQKDILSEDLKAQGFSDEEVKEAIEDYEDAGLLYKQSKRSLNRLQKSTKSKREKLLEQQEEQNKKDRQQKEKQWNKIVNTVKEGSLKGVKIPDTEKEEFINWMNTPVDDQGTTQREKDTKELDTESQLALEYLIYKKFDFSKLVENKAKSLNVNRFKKSGTKKGNMKSQGGRSKSSGSRKLPTIDQLI